MCTATVLTGSQAKSNETFLEQSITRLRCPLAWAPGWIPQLLLFACA